MHGMGAEAVVAVVSVVAVVAAVSDAVDAVSDELPQPARTSAPPMRPVAARR